MYTSANIHQDVALIIDGCGEFGNYDVQGITDEIHETYGLIPPEKIAPNRFWDIVANHRTVVPV